MEREEELVPSGEDAVPADVSPTEHDDAQPPDPDDDHVVEDTGGAAA